MAIAISATERVNPKLVDEALATASEFRFAGIERDAKRLLDQCE